MAKQLTPAMEVLKKGRTTLFIKAAAGSSSPDGARATNPGFKKDYNHTWWFPWGPNNLWPQELLTTIAPSIASTGNYYNVNLMLGRGVMPCTITNDDEGEEKIKPLIDPVQQKFFQLNKVNRFMLEETQDFIILGNAFVELILSRDRSQINRVSTIEGSFCRFKRANISGIIEQVGVYANWERPILEDIIKIPLLDQYNPLEDLRSRKTGHKFILAVNYPSPGKTYYQDTFWQSAVTSGWVEVGNEVPEYKKAMFKNFMPLGYHIKIPITHWSHKFKDWMRKSEEEQLRLIEAELDMMEKVLTGSKNARKAFISHFGLDPISKKEEPGWGIEAIDNKMQVGEFLPESSAANSEILFRQMIDPSIFGAGTPGGPYSGKTGGTDKREAFLIKIATLKPFRDCITEPLYLIRDYNGWNPETEYRFRDTILTTLDKNPTGIQPAKQ